MSATAKILITEIEGDLKPEEGLKKSPAAKGSESSELLKAQAVLFAWLFFLVVGGGMMALYYSRIGYLPNIDWQSLLIYLAAASLIGVSVGGLELILVFLPGYIWAEFLVVDPNIEEALCYRKAGYTEPKVYEPCVFEIFKRLGAPFGIIFLVAHLVLPQGLKLYLPVMIAPFVCSLIWVIVAFYRRVQDRREKWSLLIKYGFWFTISVILSQAALGLIYLLAEESKEEAYSILIGICTLGVLISNHAVAVSFRNNRRQAFMISVVAAALLLFAVDYQTSLSEKLMALYGFGRNCKVDLLLTEAGAEALGKMKIPDTPFDPAEPRRVCGVEILSSVGSEYFLSINQRNVTLPKLMVISWAASDKRKKSVAARE